MSDNWVFSWSQWWSTFMSHATPLSLSKECVVHCRIVYLSRLVMLPSIFVVPPNVQSGFEEVLPLQSTQSLCQYLWVIHMVTTFTIIQELCSEFHVIDVGLIMAFLGRDHSCWHQLIIRQIVLETIFSTLRSVCLNDSFSHFQHKFTSLTFDR